MLTADYFKQTFKFVLGGSAPLYAQLASYIRIQIQASVFKPGDQMITENELCEILKVSRTTIRQCMNRLVDEGLLVRSRGKGSFIADQKLRRSINYMYNFTENIRNAGAVPSSIVLEKAVKPADQIIREKLQLPEGTDQVFFLVRLRRANDEPIVYETTYVPYYLCEGIENFDFSQSSLYQILNSHYSLVLSRAEEMIEAIILNSDMAKKLACKGKMPGFSIQRTSYLESGYIFEYTTSITRADKCVYRLDLYNNKSNSNRKGVDFERQIQVM